jgi:hypothetical protein
MPAGQARERKPIVYTKSSRRLVGLKKSKRTCGMFFLTTRLNDDRQGEGGTLAVINVNNTTRINFVKSYLN